MTWWAAIPGIFVGANGITIRERYGIEASPQVTDGGGNVATHNELGSCVNLTCKS